MSIFLGPNTYMTSLEINEFLIALFPALQDYILFKHP